MSLVESFGTDVQCGRSRMRNVVFTICNYVGDECDKIAAWNQVNYFACGQEVCPKTFTPHLQGYMEFKQPVMLQTIRNKISMKIRCFERRGTAEQAIKYALKDGEGLRTQGTPSKQGERTDLAGPIELIQSGGSMKQVAQTFPEQFVKFNRGLRELKNILIEPRKEKPTVTVLYGATGTGKSLTARKILNDSPYVWGPEQEKWFDGYEGEKDVIFEEYRGQLPFGQMLRLLDRYDCKVQYKGGMCQFAATNIVITSPVHPSEWYKNLSDDEGKMDQLFRRITEIRELVPDLDLRELD